MYELRYRRSCHNSTAFLLSSSQQLNAKFLLAVEKYTALNLLSSNGGNGGPGSVIAGGNGGGSGVSVSGVSVGGGGSSNGTMMGVGHNGGGNGLLDDGLTLDGNGMGNGVGGINMDGSGHLNDLLTDNGDIIGDLNTTFNIDGLVHGVDLGLGLNNGGTNGLGATENSGDLDGEMGGGGLVDGGGVAGDIAGLSEMNLLGYNGGGLVDGGHTCSLGINGVGGGEGDGSSSVSNSNGGGGSSQGSGGIAKVTSVAEVTGITEVAQSGGGSYQGSGRGAIGAGKNTKCNKGPHTAMITWSVNRALVTTFTSSK